MWGGAKTTTRSPNIFVLLLKKVQKWKCIKYTEAFILIFQREGVKIRPVILLFVYSSGVMKNINSHHHVTLMLLAPPPVDPNTDWLFTVSHDQRSWTLIPHRIISVISAHNDHPYYLLSTSSCENVWGEVAFLLTGHLGVGLHVVNGSGERDLLFSAVEHDQPLCFQKGLSDPEQITWSLC